MTTKLYSCPSCKNIGESKVKVVAELPVVASTFISAGSRTFLPKGISFVLGYPLTVFLTSTQTGRTVSFAEKN